MSRHLSPEQMTRWMMGEYTAQDEEHVRDCWTCGAEVNRVERAVWLFQHSVKDFGQENCPEFRSVRSVKHSAFRTPALRWAVVVLALLLLVGIPVQTIRQSRQREARAAQVDAALLEQVDAEVSRAVPAPMEPLAQLVTSGSGSSPASK